MRRTVFPVGVVLALIAALAPAGPATAQVIPWAPVELGVPIEPTPFRRDGLVNLVYEVHITSLSPVTQLLTRVDILADAPGAAPIASYADSQVIQRLVRPVPAQRLLDGRMIESGKRAVFYVWLTVDEARVPHALRHRLTFAPLAGGPEQSVEGAALTVRSQAAPVLSPPFRGTWAARFLSNTAAHRRTLMPMQGSLRIMQRFAIDFSMFGDDWEYARADGTTNADVYGYGRDVLAVADGIVAGVRDSIPDNDPTTPSGALPNTWATATGNNVILDIGSGNYALYAHLKPGGIVVKSGQRVKRGQVLAHIGNSGNTTGPHLHFQLMDHADPARAEGVPYVFESFDVLGRETLDEFLAGHWRPDPKFAVLHVRREMTPDMAIVRFR